MSNSNHEDAIMKMGFEYFRDSLLKTLGVPYEFVDVSQTELVELTITKLYMDFTFLTTEDKYVHFEFQTTDKKEADLRRFRAYEAVFSHRQGKDVITYVIYSGGITNTVTEMNCGINVYRVQAIYLKEKDAEEVFDRLRKKQQNCEKLTEEDFAQLSLTPLICGNDQKKTMIKNALQIARQSQTIAAEKTMAILYTLADKFLEGKDLDDIKEVFYMTRLGQMIFDDGVEKGKSDGRIEGRLEGRSEGKVLGAEQMAKLTGKLLDENRLEDLRRITEDKEYRDKLLKEYEIA